MKLKLIFTPNLTGQSQLKETVQLRTKLQSLGRINLAEVSRQVSNVYPKVEFKVRVVDADEINPLYLAAWGPVVPVSQTDFTAEDLLFIEGSGLMRNNHYCEWWEIRNLFQQEGLHPEIWTVFTPRGAHAEIFRDSRTFVEAPFHLTTAA